MRQGDGYSPSMVGNPLRSTMAYWHKLVAKKVSSWGLFMMHSYLPHTCMLSSSKPIFMVTITSSLEVHPISIAPMWTFYMYLFGFPITHTYTCGSKRAQRLI